MKTRKRIEKLATTKKSPARKQKKTAAPVKPSEPGDLERRLGNYFGQIEFILMKIFILLMLLYKMIVFAAAQMS
ncbi:MAG TPA: hypothetical protein VF721_12485 [Pyrinomonadaceae bacterium]|jgi:hypothetical protein